MKTLGRRVSALVTAGLALVSVPSRARAQLWSLRTPLPLPTGAHAVGTDVLRIVDSSRAASRSIRTRPLVVQRWYPARRGTGVPASYLAEPALLDSMMRAGYLDLRPDEMRGWRDVRLRARLGARAAAPPDPRGWPVIVLSHGLGAARSHYSALAQELASHGYVVLAIDHPIGGFTLAPDGRLLRPGVDSLHYSSSPLASVVRDWAIDDAFVVRRAAALAAPGSAAGGGVVIDTTRVAAIGHSLGGAAALQACLSQPLFDACADMDGDVFGDVETTGIGKPILVLLSQPDRRRRPPARDSAESARREEFARMGRERDSTWTAICARQRGAPCFVVKLVGTAHFSFSDAPFQMPSQLRGVGATRTPAEMHRAMTVRLLDFLDHELRSKPLRILEAGLKAVQPR
jgi:dienelactone hydrolase